MSWSWFIYFAVASLLLWWTGAALAWKEKRTWSKRCTAVGILVLAAYIALMWISLQRPPLKTMGETRLWYAFFLPVVGLVTYSRWRYRWLPTFAALMATVFTLINLLKPEIHSQALMPALQSPWFAPHVIVYMFSYALMGAAFLVAVYLLLVPVARYRLGNDGMRLCDNLVSVGMSFLTLGMLFGAIWAKQAWGHYWTWDPKETWAAATWMLYLGYLHYRKAHAPLSRPALWMLVWAFLALQMCWWGINFLPSAAGMSVHTY